MPLLIMLIIAALCASPSRLQGDDDTALSQADLDFFKQAISINEAEIRLARIAANHHLMVPLQALADGMVMYHTAALNQLMTLSQAKKAGLADEIQPGDLMDVDALNGVADSEVPERFIAMRIAWLKRCIDAFTTEIDDGNDIDLKEFAATALTRSRFDLDAAQGLEAKH
jgi:putative membrane protein